MLHLAAWLRLLPSWPESTPNDPPISTNGPCVKPMRRARTCPPTSELLRPWNASVSGRGHRPSHHDVRQAAFGVPVGREPDINALPPIPSQWDGVTQLLHACAVVAAPESDLVPPALLLSLEPMVNTTEDELALARCWVGLGEEARARPCGSRASECTRLGGGAHGCVGDGASESGPVDSRRTNRQSTFGPVKTGSVQDVVSQTKNLAAPADPVLAGEYRLTTVEVSLRWMAPDLHNRRWSKNLGRACGRKHVG